MAVAGKVAITPQGAWDSTVLYDKLSLVTHENAIYIAKKQSQGVVPVDGEYWMFCMQNAGAEDIQNIVNGTTVVGKATNDSDGNKISETYMKKILELSETDVSDETELVSYEEETPKKRTSVKMWEYIKGKIDSVLGIKGISNNVVTTESGYAADATQLNESVDGSYAKGIANKIASINSDLLKINSVSSAYGAESFNYDMLYVETEKSRQSTYFAINTTGSTIISNLPPITEATTVIGYREVFYRNDDNIMIKATEMYPVAGRIWTNFYNTGTWTGWITNITSNNFQRTKTFFGEVSAHPEYYTIYAHGVSVFNEASKTMDLHFSIVPYKVEDVTIPALYQFMSKEKFLKILDISTWSFDIKNTSVKPCTDVNSTGVIASSTCTLGASGIYMNSNNMCFGRFYNTSGSFGDWAINHTLYEDISGKQINIDIYGATYS